VLERLDRGAGAGAVEGYGVGQGRQALFAQPALDVGYPVAAVAGPKGEGGDVGGYR